MAGFPKTCACGESYSREEFLALKAPVGGDLMGNERYGFLVLRQCICQSTLAVRRERITAAAQVTKAAA